MRKWRISLKNHSSTWSYPEPNLCWTKQDHAERRFWPYQRPKTVQKKAELLSSSLQQLNVRDWTLKDRILLQPREFRACLHNTGSSEGLMATVYIRYSREEWQLFTDCSMHSLKAILLHTGNVLSSIAVHYTENMKICRHIWAAWGAGQVSVELHEVQDCQW
jgi:hypothetical protein